MPTYRPIEEAVRITGVSRRTLDRWIKEGKLTGYRIMGDRRRYVDIDQVRHLREPQPDRDS